MTFNGKVKVLMLKGEKGDAGNSGDYSGLTNKPSINGVELSGNKSSGDLGLESAGGLSALRTELLGDITDLRSEILSDMFKTFSDNFQNISIGAGDYYSHTYDLSHSGYTPIAIAGFSISNGCLPRTLNLTTTGKVSVNIYNPSSSALSNVTVTVYVLYIKSA